MKKIIVLAVMLFSLFASSAQADEPIYDSCPNIEGEQWGIPAGYELKWSNHYGAYICVVQHQFSPKR